MKKPMITITLKLYRPTLRKRIILDEAIHNYTKAYNYLLSKAMAGIDIIEKDFADINGKFSSNFLKKWVNKDLDKELNQFGIEPFKDSLKVDFSSMLAGYLNSRLRSHTFFDLNNFNSSSYKENGDDKQELDSFRAIYFCRYDKNRNYSLLYDEINNKYYAKMYLMNAKNEKRKNLTPNIDKSLVYINKNKEPFKEAFNKKCFVIFPLSFGKYQEGHLNEAVKNPEMLRTARLYRHKNEYYLSISLEKKAAKTIKAENYIGISRGISNSLNYSIVDKSGKLISKGFFKNWDINDAHKVANSIVKLAEENRCQVIVENFAGKNDNLAWVKKDGESFYPKINIADYNKLLNLLTYKLLICGLPKIIGVSCVNLFNTCPFCETTSKGNRFSNDMLICTSCGITINVEEAGALNLSRKLIKYNKEKIKIKVENTKSGLKFSNNDLKLEFYTNNVDNCINECKIEIDSIIKQFYDNINTEYLKTNFKKKLSLIKKVENNKDIFEFIQVY